MTFPTVYCYDFNGRITDIDDISHLLGKERYEYCRKKKSKRASLSSACAFLLLRYVLCNEFGIKGIPQFICNEHGKPFLRDEPGIFFSMSHSGTTCICAAAGSPVGADIQDIRNIDIRTAGKFLTDSELSEVSEISDKTLLNEELCRIWCIKESYGKYTGKGFSEGFRTFGADMLINSGKVLCTRRDNYYISVCI